MMIKKIMLVGLCAAYMPFIASMELQVDLKTSSSIESENSPHDCYAYLSYGVNVVSGALNSGLTSATNTLATSLSEYQRFKKLGWPPHDPVAQEGLKDTKDLYQEVKKIATNKIFSPEISLVLARFDRRVLYAQEFVHTFLLQPDHAEGLERARYSLEHHASALSMLYKEMVISYLEQKRDTSKSISVGLDLDLKKFKRESLYMLEAFKEEDERVGK
jgi:hypothetical protein